MAQITYRGNLSAANFPLTLASAGRTVIVPGSDNNYDRRVDPEGEQKDAGIPQAIYLENVIPTANGYQSVGYVTVDSLPNTSYKTFDQIDAVFGGGVASVPAAAVSLSFSPPSTFKCISEAPTWTGGWRDVTFSGAASYPTHGISGFEDTGWRITHGIVRGTSYVFYQGVDALGLNATAIYTAEYNLGLTLTNVSGSLSGILITEISEICSSFNYLIVAKKDGSVAWSSTTNALDFTPSVVSGSGSIEPNNAFNRITHIEACATGFNLYTPKGVIAARYTGNARYPWKFVPIVNTAEAISFSYGNVTAANTIIIDGTGSIRQLQDNEAVLVSPELAIYFRNLPNTDSYNYTTNSTYTEIFRSDILIKAYFLFDRYVFVSVEAESQYPALYNAVLVYDILLKRYGRLKINHTHIAPYIDNNSALNKNKVAFINLLTGQRFIWDTEVANESIAHQGVLILGKFQYVRSRNLCLDAFDVEGIFDSTTEVVILPSLNGKEFDTAVVPYNSYRAENLISYNTRAEARNHSIVLKGKFSIDSLELTFHVGAGR